MMSMNDRDVDLVSVLPEPQDLGDVDQEMSAVHDIIMSVDNTRPILEMDLTLLIWITRIDPQHLDPVR